MTPRKPVPPVDELVEPRKKISPTSDTSHTNKGEKMNAKIEEPAKPSTIERIKPVVKKTLLWIGVGAGFLLAGVLLAKTFETADETLEVEELPANVTELKKTA